jgi:hypothetical protein
MTEDQAPPSSIAVDLYAPPDRVPAHPLFQLARRFYLSANSRGKTSNGFAIVLRAKTSASNTLRGMGALGRRNRALTSLSV